jgi:predicted DsbA family dithiol-disulfide isomerase
MKIQVTYFLDVTSSWCHWAEPAWAEIRERYATQVSFDWQISIIPTPSLPASREQCDWFYRRSGTVTRSLYRLNSGWLEPGPDGYPVPNLVAEAARSMGARDDRTRLALANAAMRDGRRIGRWEEALAVASATSGLDPKALRRCAESPETRQAIEAGTARFHEFKMTQRPAFLIENTIGDRATLSGTWRAEPLAAVLDDFLQDANAYASFAEHFGGPPPA